MLDELVSNQFKVSNVPTLTGWNVSMSIMDMLDQLETTYGKPNAMTLFANDTLFRSAFNPNDAPEALFHCIEQCQEIAVLACDPYSNVQVINNAVRLLMQTSIFPMKEFDDWEAVTPKTYPTLKKFIVAAYTCHILSQQLRNMAGQMGYAPQTHNMYAALDDNNDATTATDGTTTTLNLAAMTTGSTLTGAHTTAVPESIANAINQLSANQLVLMTQISQIMAMSLAQRTQTPSFPTMQAQQQGVSVRERQQEGGVAEGTGATDMADAAPGAEADKMTVHHLPPTNRGSRNRSSKDGDAEWAGTSPKDRQDSSRRHRLGVTTHQQCPRSTFVRRFANNNVCYLCGFNIEDGHTSVTCPRGWQKTNYQEAFTRENTQGYIAGGWDACTKGKHKNLFPKF